MTESLRYITSTGGAMPTATLGALRERLPETSVFLMYGLTEAFRSTYLPPEELDRRPTMKNLKKFGLEERLTSSSNVDLLMPLPYIDFMNIVTGARMVITDSGGLQEETTYLGIPCLTMRENTERPVTVTLGTNALVDAAELPGQVKRISVATGKRARVHRCGTGTRLAARLPA